MACVCFRLRTVTEYAGNDLANNDIFLQTVDTPRASIVPAAAITRS